MHVLVLGGVAEARDLAGRLAARPGCAVTLSLAGRTRAPLLPPGCAVRIGGFGGAEGLARWIAAEGVAALVDATHPFARRISAHAEAAAAATGTPLVVLERAPWAEVPGDRWIRVPDMAAAAAALGGLLGAPLGDRPAGLLGDPGAQPARVLLAIGRQELAAFRAVPGPLYLVRSVEPPDPADLPPGAETLLARGPFDAAEERALLATRGIAAVVAKNSGGDATYGKIAAARALGLPVILVDRPARPGAAATVAEALARLDRLRPPERRQA